MLNEYLRFFDRHGQERSAIDLLEENERLKSEIMRLRNENTRLNKIIMYTAKHSPELLVLPTITQELLDIE